MMDSSLPNGLFMSEAPSPLFDPLIPPLSPLIGREREFALLKRHLESHPEHILLTGLPGVGKTTLAIALALDPGVRALFPDGILWAGLGVKPDLVGHLHRWAQLCGLPLSTSPKKETLSHLLQDRRMLLIIDDAWNINDALALKIGGRICTHLITARFPNLAAHLSPQEALVLHELSTEQSLDLLHLLAPQIVERESSKARTLVQTVGGLPLALTLMGNYLRLHTIGGHTRRIQAALEQIGQIERRLHLSEPQGPLERHPGLAGHAISLHEMIALSDKHLSDKASATLYALSVLPPKPSSFSKASALAVSQTDETALDALLDAGLLERAGDDGRYTLHQTIADYARSHLQDDQPVERFICSALTLAKQHRADYGVLEQETDTILAALECAYEHHHQSALVTGVCAFAPFLIARGNYPVADLYLERAHQTARERDEQDSLIPLDLYRGQLSLKRGKYEQAQTILQEGLTLARSLEHREEISALLRELGWVAWKQGNSAQAQALLQEGLALARSLGNLEQISGLLALLGTVAAPHDTAQSEAYLREGLVLARLTGNQEHLCLLLLNLGATIADTGACEQALAILEEGLSVARSIGHYEWMSAILSNLGALSSLQKRYPQAEAYFREGLLAARKIQHRERMGIILLNLGEAAVAQHRWPAADLYLQETLTLARQLQRPQLLARAYYELGNMYLRQDNTEEASTYFEQMLHSIPDGDRELQGLLQFGQARVAARQGNYPKARQLATAAATSLDALGHYQASEVRLWLMSLGKATT